jgi:hypothetical protein
MARSTASVAWRNSLLRDPRNPRALLSLVLRRLRDAGALVALGIVLSFQFDQIISLMRFWSESLTILPRRKLRLRFLLFELNRCPLPGREYLSLPEAVTLTRLAVIFLVFFFGIAFLPFIGIK